ncbi:MAG: transglycosylase domain-containing protein [Chitinophagales bacterium]
MPTRFKTYIKIMWLLYVGLVTSCMLFFVGINYGMLGELPTFEELETPKTALASEIYDNKGDLLGRYYIEDRTNADPSEIPQTLIDALISVEDVRFYEHSGIDMRSMWRVLIKTFLLGQNAGGGSTITQQIAKNLFHQRNNNWKSVAAQKFKEWVIAVRLEKSYTKDELATMYLNLVPFNYNAHGIKAAAKRYFNCEPQQLKVEEMALLIGMLKGPSYYNPKKYPERAISRRNTVLRQMCKYKKITHETCTHLLPLPLQLRFYQDAYYDGKAAYFREYIKEKVNEWAEQNPKSDSTFYDIYRDGLRIYTTLDSQIQAHAENAISKHLTVLQEQFYREWENREPWETWPKVSKKLSPAWKNTNIAIHRGVIRSERYQQLKSDEVGEETIKEIFETPAAMSIFSWKGERDTILTPLDSVRYYKKLLQTGFLATNPQNGEIQAWVGGINFKHFQYDNVKKSVKHQVGSLFKPFVYTLAIQNNWKVCKKVPNLSIVPKTQQDIWKPQSANLYKQNVNLKEGLAHSINYISAHLMKRLSPEVVIDLVRELGIDSEIEAKLDICLGTPKISLYEMLGAYATYANQGFYNEPFAIKRIEDRQGNVLAVFRPKKKEAISSKTAYTMLGMMEEVVKNGTAIHLQSRYDFDNMIAAKTGVTDDNANTWFVGLVPQLAAGIWVGGDDKSVRFRTLKTGSGANTALPIWANFMNEIYADSSLNIRRDTIFVQPENYDITILDCTEEEEKKGGYNDEYD